MYASLFLNIYIYIYLYIFMNIDIYPYLFRNLRTNHLRFVAQPPACHAQITVTLFTPRVFTL